jgi:hypothetical protein
VKKKLLPASSAIAGLLAVSILGLVLFLDANRFRRQLEQTMGEVLGRKVSIGNVKAAREIAGSNPAFAGFTTTAVADEPPPAAIRPDPDRRGRSLKM